MERSTFSSRIGFVLAAAGSAVGLGNIWRFPYLAARYGGGVFLIVYVALALTFGFTLMITEIAIGRKTGLSVVGAFRKLNAKWTFLGVLAAIVPIIIVPYYSVIGGWVTKYFATYVSGAGMNAADDLFFTDFIANPYSPLFWTAIFILITFFVVAAGVKKGVERVSKILMPILIILTIGITVYGMTLPGASDGVAYYFIPDFSKFSPQLILGALGQMFYSMSLAMGIMITYGSYMKKSDNLDKAVKQIEWFDTGIAILAGLMIIPPIFVFSGTTDAVNAGPSLMFITMPKVFHSMGNTGHIIGTLFFALVLFAALTSAISLMETVVSIFIDKFKFSRIKACIIVLIMILVLAVPSSLGFGIWSGASINGMTILDMCDFASNSVLMPIVALLTCIFVGYILKPEVIIGEVTLNGVFKREKMYKVFIKYVAPILVLFILISSVLEGLGLFNI